MSPNEYWLVSDTKIKESAAAALNHVVLIGL